MQQQPFLFTIPRTRLAAALLFAFASTTSQASCGSASCNLLNDRFALGTWDHVGWSSDVRLEALSQTQLREGTNNIRPADLPPGEEAIERHTINRNLVTTLDYAASAEWSFTLRLPVVQRDHLHDLLDEDTGDITSTERWHFRKLGDVQALARWQAPAGASQDMRWALTGGLKLPTGAHSVSNREGTVAERALQPGSGTTDAVLGASARAVLGLADALSLQATWTQPLAARDGFKPGRKLELSAGWSHAMDRDWSVLLQANLSRRSHDSGSEAEPDLSGSTTLSLSPGLSLAVGHADTVYAVAQAPVYQKVHGIQLIPRFGLALGWTHGF